ncbi:hypothetical protein [Escherichia coli]|uniref:hypothetical protein n=1 Tax=Escherichia coli TaxID=562 RepID=UPI00388F9444
MEFEAVFFVSIDQLATLHPALFDKYLYVVTNGAIVIHTQRLKSDPGGNLLS